MLLLTLACAEATTDPVQSGQHDSEATSPGACPSVGVRPDGSCCPKGRFYDVGADRCEATGPPECADLTLEAPATCVPRWCWSLIDAEGAKCDAKTPGCLPLGRRCSADELAAGAGCPTGSWPAPWGGGACVAAGHGPTTTGGDGQPAASPVDRVEPPLPPLVTPRWCWNAGNTRGAACAPGTAGCTMMPRICTAAEKAAAGGCPAGTYPTPRKPGACSPAGVDWLCPPGFIADEAAAVATGQLRPCLPDPADCGDDPFGDAKDDGNTIFVDMSVNKEGDGSRAAPLSSLSKAMSQAKWGATIALAAGTYPGGLTISKKLTLRGRCAAMVTLAGTAWQKANVQVASAEESIAGLHRLRLTGPTWGLQVTGIMGLQASRLYFDGVAGVALNVLVNPNVSLRESVINNMAVKQKSTGTGINVGKGASLTLEYVRVHRARIQAVAASGVGTAIHARHLLIDGTLTSPGYPYGVGLQVQGGAHADYHWVRVTGSLVHALMAEGANSEVQLHGARIEGTRSAPGAVFSAAVYGFHKAVVKVVGSHVEDSEAAGLYARHSGSHMSVTGVRIDSTLPGKPDYLPGDGILVGDGATAHVDACRATANQIQGVRVVNVGSTLTARELVVDWSDAPASTFSNHNGHGVVVRDGGQVDLAHCRLSSNRTAGLAVYDGGLARASDLLVDGTRMSAATHVYLDASDHRGMKVQQLGVGVDVLHKGTVELNGARLHANHYAGLVCGDTCRARVAGLLVEDTIPDGDPRYMTTAVIAGVNATLDLAGARLTGNEGVGLLSFEENPGNPSMRTRAAGLVVDRSIATAGAFHGRTNGGKGGAIGGAVVSHHGHLELFSALFALNAGAGLSAFKNAFVRLEGCVIRHTTVAYFNPDLTMSGKLVELADGVVAGGKDAQILDSIITGHTRAGVLATTGSKANIGRSVISSNGFGLVLQNAAPVDHTGTVIHDNPLGNLAGDAGLSVPPPPMTELPDSEG